MENTTPTQVEKAILVMYGISSTPSTPISPQAQNAAIQWLSVFNDSSVSWLIYPILLQSSHTRVRFYAANGLYSKIRSYWHLLTRDERNHIEEELWATLDSLTEADKPVLSRIVLALATVSLLSAKEGHVEQFIQRIITTVQELLEQDDDNTLPSSSRSSTVAVSSSTSSSSSSNHHRLSSVSLGRYGMLQLCVSLLKELEILYDDLGKKLQEETREAARLSIIAAAPTVLDLCGALLSDNFSPFAVPKAAETAGSVDDPSNIEGKPAMILTGTETALACAAGWVYFLDINPTPDTNEPTNNNTVSRIVYIANHHMPLLEATVDALTSVPHGTIADAAVDFLQIAFQPSELASTYDNNDGDDTGDSLGGMKIAPPPTEESDEVLAELIKTLVSSAPYLQACIEDCRWSVAGAYGRLLSALAENETEWITGRGALLPLPDDISVSHFPYVGAAVDAHGDGSTIGDAVIGLGVLVGDLALQCAAIPDLMLAERVLSCFQYIAYMDMESRHPYYQHIMFRQLSLIVVSQCIDARSTFPSPTDDDILNINDNEELQRYRWEYPDNWKEYRRAYSIDTLGDCVNALGADILQLLAGLLEPEDTPTLHDFPLPVHVSKVSRDTRLEGIFHCLGYIGKEVLDRMEDEDTDGSAGEYLASLFIFGIERSAKDLHPSLAVTICRFIEAYRGWLHTLSPHQPVRYTMDGPFRFLSLTDHTSTPSGSHRNHSSNTNSSSSVTASIGFLPTNDLFESIFGYLISGLECVNVRSGFTSAARLVKGRTTAAALKLLTGKSTGSRKIAGSSPDEIEDIEYTDNADESTVSHSTNNMAVADAAAATLYRLVLSCGTQIPVTDVIQGLVDACDSSVTGGLSIHAEAFIISACINLCSYLPVEILPQHLEAILDRPINVIQQTFSRIRNKNYRLSKYDEALTMCAFAIVEQVLRPAPAEDTQMDDNLSSSSSSGITIHAGYLQFVGEKLWKPEIDTLLSLTRDNTECVGVLFAFMSQTLRCFPSLVNEARIQSIMESAVDVYQGSLHSGALTLLQETISILVKANTDEQSSEVPIQLPSSVTDMFAEMMHILVDTTLAAAVQSLSVGLNNKRKLPTLSKCPESCSGIYSLAFDILRLSPETIASEAIGPGLLQLLPHVCAIGDIGATVAAIRFFERLYLCFHNRLPSLYLTNISPSDAVCSNQVAQQLSTLIHTNTLNIGIAIAASLTGKDDYSLDSVRHTTKLFELSLYTDFGTEIAESVIGSIEESAAAQVEEEIERCKGNEEQIQKIRLSVVRGEPIDSATGLLSFTPQERDAIISMAVSYVLYKFDTHNNQNTTSNNKSNIGRSSSPSSPSYVSSYANNSAPLAKFNQLLTEFANVCRRMSNKSTVLKMLL